MPSLRPPLVPTAWLAALTALAPPAILAAGQAGDAAPSVESRLDASLRPLVADRLTDILLPFVASEARALESLELATDVALAVAEFDPEDVDRWRIALRLSDITERRDQAERAVAEIVRLDPQDEVARLRRFVLWVERNPTAAERVEAYRQLLAAEIRPQVGPFIASRLAMDLALLLRRMGDVEGYAEWIAEAVALDPANPAAANEVAGFFETTTDDPVAIVELHVARCLANPANVDATVRLGEVLLRFGAFRAAERLLDLAVQAQLGPRGAPPLALEQLTLAHWGAGEADRALALIDVRERASTEFLRLALTQLRSTSIDGAVDEEAYARTRASLRSPAAQEEMDELVSRGILAPLQGTRGADGSFTYPVDPILSVTAPLDPGLAAVQAAILSFRPGSGATSPGAALTRTQLRMARSSVRSGAEPAAIAADLAQRALSILFLGDNPPAARELLREAEKQAPEVLTPATRQLFDGWFLLRERRFAEAEAMLAPIASEIQFARLGHAIAQREQGNLVGSAGGLLAMARDAAGSVVGLWSLQALLSDLGQVAPLYPEVPEIESLVSAMPAAYDRLVLDPQRELGIVLRPARDRFDAGDRLLGTIEIVNRSGLRLAIAPGGPLRSPVLVPMGLATFGAEQQVQEFAMPPVIGIDQRLSIGPRDTLVLPVNFGRALVGETATLERLVDQAAMAGNGTILRGRAILNPVPAYGAESATRVIPGPAGSSSPPVSFQVDPVPRTAEWYEMAFDAVQRIDEERDLLLLAVMVQRVVNADPSRLAELPPDERQFFEDVLREQASAIANAVPQLGDIGLAWLVLHMRSGPGRSTLQVLEEAARRSESPVVRLAALLLLPRGPDDPMLAETQRGEDLRLRRVAAQIAEALRRQAAEE